jgi:hypothetical protein
METIPLVFFACGIFLPVTPLHLIMVALVPKLFNRIIANTPLFLATRRSD